MIYKVTIKKILYVRADSADEAEQEALDDNFLVTNEEVESVEQSSLLEAKKLLNV